MAPASTSVPKPPNRPMSTMNGTASSHLASQIALRASANENRARSAPLRTACKTPQPDTIATIISPGRKPATNSVLMAVWE